MKNYFFLILVFGSLLYTSCNCPDDERTGELSLEQRAQDFVAYDGAETLTFIDEAGATLSLTTSRGMEVNNDKLCYRSICTEAKFGSPSSCEYYDAESRRFTYFSNDNTAALDILLYSEIYGNGMPDFYDALQVNISVDESGINGTYLIELRVEGEIDSTKINLNDPFIESEEITINGQLFSDVLVIEEGNNGLYFKEGEGVIGFKNNEHTWVIQD